MPHCVERAWPNHGQLSALRGSGLLRSQAPDPNISEITGIEPSDSITASTSHAAVLQVSRPIRHRDAVYDWLLRFGPRGGAGRPEKLVCWRRRCGSATGLRPGLVSRPGKAAAAGTAEPVGPFGEDQVGTESTGGAVVGACHRDSERPCARIARQGVVPQARFTGSGKWVLT